MLRGVLGQHRAARRVEGVGPARSSGAARVHLPSGNPCQRLVRITGVDYSATSDVVVHGAFRRPATLVAVDLSALSDEDLLELVAERRDGEAFEVLYRRYSRAVYAVVRRMVSDRGRSEDVVQEAFASVWRAAAGFRQNLTDPDQCRVSIAASARADRRRQYWGRVRLR